MLLVRTTIGPSNIAGLGLFADQFIPKGTPIWKYAPGFDQTIPEHDIAQLPELGKKAFLHYAYHNKRSGEYVLCFDDARFFNHAEAPNTHEVYEDGDDYGLDIASRDIQPKEELTTDYGGFDSDLEYKMTPDA
jgi:uncharacterized protein